MQFGHLKYHVRTSGGLLKPHPRVNKPVPPRRKEVLVLTGRAVRLGDKLRVAVGGTQLQAEVEAAAMTLTEEELYQVKVFESDVSEENAPIEQANIADKVFRYWATAKWVKKGDPVSTLAAWIDGVSLDSRSLRPHVVYEIEVSEITAKPQAER